MKLPPPADLSRAPLTTRVDGAVRWLQKRRQLAGGSKRDRRFLAHGLQELAPDLPIVGRLPDTHDIGFHGEHDPPVWSVDRDGRHRRLAG